jgi:hypothetical protein
MRGGLFGVGSLVSKLTGKELTVHQKAKQLAYGKLKSFSEFGYFDFKVEDEFGNKPELVAFAGYMINGFYGLINIQTENDVIALRRLFIKFKKGGANLFAKLPGRTKTPLQEEWIAAGQPEPIIGNIMMNAKGIIENAGKKGLLRSTFNPGAGTPENTTEAKNAVLALNEADDARATGRIGPAEFSEAIGGVTYDASPYATTPEKKSSFPSFFGGKSRKNKSKSRRSKSKSKSRRSRH